MVSFFGNTPSSISLNLQMSRINNQDITIFDACEVRIENSVTRLTVSGLESPGLMG